jgi:hypothetical protein
MAVEAMARVGFWQSLKASAKDQYRVKLQMHCHYGKQSDPETSPVRFQSLSGHKNFLPVKPDSAASPFSRPSPVAPKLLFAWTVHTR